MRQRIGLSVTIPVVETPLPVLTYFDQLITVNKVQTGKNKGGIRLDQCPNLPEVISNVCTALVCWFLDVDSHGFEEI